MHGLQHAEVLDGHKDAGRPSVRILHVVDSLGIGGIGVTLVNLVRRTHGELHHTVCCVRERGPLADRLGGLGVPTYFLRKRDGNDWTLAFRIARLCRTVRPDIVRTCAWGASDGIVGARLAGVPVVIHSEHGRDLPNVGGDRYYRRTLARRLLAVFSDRIVVVSEHLRRWLVDDVGVRGDKIAVVPNGVEPGAFRPTPDRVRLRCARGYDAGAVLIGVVARLDAVKNHCELIDAFASVSRRCSTARLVIVGDGPERGAIERRIEHHGLGDTVQLVGQRDDVPAWLAMMDIYVQPSLMEGTGNAILEAMATGLPVVATRVGGNPEVVVDGVTGRLVSVGNPAAMAEAIAAYAANACERATHGAAGRARVERCYSIAATAARYTALYRGALMRAGRRYGV